MPTARRRVLPFPGRFLSACLLAGLGSLAGLTLAEFLLRWRPQILPGTVQVDPPVRRVRAWRDETYEVRVSDGDIYHWRRAEFRPLAPDEDVVLARVRFLTDAEGFRNNPSRDAGGTIVALGDSYTEGGNVGVPWPARLAEMLDQPVLNLGEAGAGPQHALRNLVDYGGSGPPKLVILAWFEGNDLLDAGAWVRIQPLLVARAGRHLIDRMADLLPHAVAGHAAPPRRFPVGLSIGGASLQMAFWPGHISLLSVDRETIESSRNFALAREAIRSMRARVESIGARFLLVNAPARTRVYLPMIAPAERARLLEGIPAMALDAEGFLAPAAGPAGEAGLNHLDDQATAMGVFAREEGIPFLDLASRFREEAATGATLYYPYDTHWNQRGHDLAAEVISRAIAGDFSAGAPRSREGIPAPSPRAPTPPPS